jgi:hypothetical protein
MRNLTAISSATPGQLLARSEAAFILLWRFHGKPPTDGQWEHGETNTSQGSPVDVEVQWDQPPEHWLGSYLNDLKTVERAAEAVAIAIADQLGFKVLGEVYHGSGADWLMIPKGEPGNDYYKLEVSGMMDVNAETPERRLRMKVAQSQRGDLQRPGMAVVVRFADMRILSETWR